MSTLHILQVINRPFVIHSKAQLVCIEKIIPHDWCQVEGLVCGPHARIFILQMRKCVAITASVAVGESLLESLCNTNVHSLERCVCC